MNEQQEQIIQSCAHGVLTFPEIVEQLQQIGVERYHVDYCRRENTYYLEDGSSLAVSTLHPRTTPATEFAAAEVEQAVRQSQRNEHSYHDFIRKTSDAGCVGYFVQICGRKVIYFGRNGETHIELFPPFESSH